MQLTIQELNSLNAAARGAIKSLDVLLQKELDPTKREEAKYIIEGCKSFTSKVDILRNEIESNLEKEVKKHSKKKTINK